MLREFLSLFRTHDALSAMGDSFREMLDHTRGMTRFAGDLYFAGTATPEERQQVYRADIQVNKLERAIRKQVIAHLSIRSNSQDVPYCLFLFSLVKDVERIGDYAKNLTELMELRPGPLPDDAITRELLRIRQEVDLTFEIVGELVGAGDRERALERIERGRALGKQCEALVREVAATDYDARTAVAAVLGTRYYKRIGGHLLNVLSSVFMPLHKLDYFDEDELRNGELDPD